MGVLKVIFGVLYSSSSSKSRENAVKMELSEPNCSEEAAS